MSKLCRFSGGGYVSIVSSHGVVVIGGTCTDENEEVTPLKEGDIATTGNIENKLATNAMSYQDTEKQLFANMHKSASEATLVAILNGDLNPNVVNRMVAYGTILKPGTNIVTLYKLVAELNNETYVQVDYQVHTIYWHSFFNRVSLYMLNKVCNK